MLNRLENIDFYMVTDSNLTKNGIFTDVENALRAGCRIVQYREKNKSTREMINEALKLKQLCFGKAIFLINDRIDVSLAVNSDGVHIGQKDMHIEIARKILGRDKIIGLTVHNLEEASNAEKIGIDYISLAPIFETNTKENTQSPVGVEMIKKIRDKINLPIVAVGGIDRENLRDVIHAGADSVVSIKSVLKANDVYKEIKDFIRIIGECKSR